MIAVESLPRAEQEAVAAILAELDSRTHPFVPIPLYPKQAAINADPHRFTITEATPKAGKTASAIEWLLGEAVGMREGNHWWVAPIKDQADIAFRRTRQRLDGYIDSRGELVRVGAAIPYEENKTRKTISIPNEKGAILWFKSADEPDSLYGEDVRRLVGDEITRWKQESWTAVYTTLIATKGRAKLIGNVKGKRNFAYHLARRAQQHEPEWGYHKLTADDAIAGGIIDAAIVEQAQRDMRDTPGLFRELFYAEAADDGANPFGTAAIQAGTGLLSTHPAVVYGVDLAKSVDWTWIVGLDAFGRVAESVRFQRPWDETINTVRQTVRSVPALVDSTGVGDAILEALQRAGGGTIEGLKFTAQSKQKLMEGLAMAIQSREVAYPPEIAAELEAYEYVYTRTGVMYSAAAGEHDDGVCALALAVQHGRSRNLLHAAPVAAVPGTPRGRMMPYPSSVGWMR